MTLPYTLSRWSLADLFTGFESQEVKNAFTQLDACVSEFENRRKQLSAGISAEDFMAIIRQLEEIHHLAHRVYGFAGLSFAADTQDQAAQSFLARVEQFMAGLENRTLFFSLWWKDLDENSAARLMTGSGDYQYWLEEMRHFKPHTLSEAEEDC